MNSAMRPGRNTSASWLPPLMNGDHMSQVEFHRNYEDYPDETRFELIAGTVYEMPPHRQAHGRYLAITAWLLGIYTFETPDVQGLISVTTILDDENEVHPDLSLRKLHGGATSVTEDGYITGAPELIFEISYYSRAIDLFQKKEAYRKAGVGEYLVLSLEPLQLHWFQFQSGRTLVPNLDGVCKSDVFPGLWIHVPALLEQQHEKLMATLSQGMQSAAHAEFVKHLQAKRSERP